VAELLVDTDVFVDHLRGSRPLEATRDRIAYSVITRCELFAGRSADEDGLRRLLAPFREVQVDRRIGELAGRLRREHGIRTPDAIIAATALGLGVPILTRNVKDFAGVRGLRVRQTTR
jgi:hypothetical protein